MTSADYKAGIDPALRVIAAAGATPDMAAEIESALGRGDSAAAMAVITRSRDNTRAFPSSANAWDSLGEALLADGSAMRRSPRTEKRSRSIPASPRQPRRCGGWGWPGSRAVSSPEAL